MTNVFCPLKECRHNREEQCSKMTITFTVIGSPDAISREQQTLGYGRALSTAMICDAFELEAQPNVTG
jgi:hypothetical protein